MIPFGSLLCSVSDSTTELILAIHLGVDVPPVFLQSLFLRSNVPLQKRVKVEVEMLAQHRRPLDYWQE